LIRLSFTIVATDDASASFALPTYSAEAVSTSAEPSFAAMSA
jgi:hypothetical protein